MQYQVQTYFIRTLTKKREATSWHGRDVEAVKNIEALISGLPKKRRAKPLVSNLAMRACTELIIILGSRGEGILIFLPGVSETTAYHCMLVGELRSRGIDQHFSLFILHSQVPLEEQVGIFDDPPPDKVKVILATNFAESSITLPKLRVVINFGLYIQLEYDISRQLPCLKKSWCSRASCVQRAGRAGRVFDEIAIHLITKHFFQIGLPEFSPPEMATASLTKLFLQAKSMAKS